MHIVRSPDAAKLAELHEAMNDAFSDYLVPMRLTKDQFGQMMRQRSLRLEASSVVMVDGEVAAFWLVGLRGPRAYLIASGTRPAHRRKGLSKLAAEHAFDLARKAGAQSMAAEVIVHNDKAIALYRSQGFEIVRTLYCYSFAPEGGTTNPTREIETADWRDVRPFASSFWDFRPSWQNEVEAVDALVPGIKCFVAHADGQLAGYAVVAKETRSLCQLAVMPQHRMKGIASALLDAAQRHLGGSVRLINVDARDAGFAAFLTSRHAEKKVQQFEISVRIGRRNVPRGDEQQGRRS